MIAVSIYIQSFRYFLLFLIFFAVKILFVYTFLLAYSKINLDSEKSESIRYVGEQFKNSTDREKKNEKLKTIISFLEKKMIISETVIAATRKTDT